MRGFEVCAPQLPGRLQPLLESASRVRLGDVASVCARIAPGREQEPLGSHSRMIMRPAFLGHRKNTSPGEPEDQGLECPQRPVAPQHLPSVSPERLREVTLLSLLCLQTHHDLQGLSRPSPTGAPSPAL